MSSKPLAVIQIAELANTDEDEVRRAMRRGELPSQEAFIVREWLHGRWERRTRRMIREEIHRG